MANQDLNKSEMVALICEHEEHIDWLYEGVRELRETLDFAIEMGKGLQERVNELENSPVVVEKAGRKDEVLAILKEGKHVSVPTLAKRIGISDRNISSQMSYLRKDGWLIATDSMGFKFLENPNRVVSR